MKTYTCKNCNEDWAFFPADYKYNKKKYPNKCPLCSMPISQAFSDIKEKEGLLEALKFVLKNRIFNI
jgi:hypothetical protein